MEIDRSLKNQNHSSASDFDAIYPFAKNQLVTKWWDIGCGICSWCEFSVHVFVKFSSLLYVLCCHIPGVTSSTPMVTMVLWPCCSRLIPLLPLGPGNY